MEMPVVDTMNNVHVLVEVRVNGNLDLETHTTIKNVSRIVKNYLAYYPNAVITIRR